MGLIALAPDRTYRIKAELAEGLLFYQNVHLLLDDDSVRELLNQDPFDHPDWLLT